jgi:CheY-like chemotaxis protein
MRGVLRQRPAVQLLHAPQGDAGLAMAVERRPQLVLLDLHLPDMPGEEVLRLLFENPATRGVPVVVVTADATPGLTRRLQAAGATAFLTKPLDIKRVLNLIDEVLGPD